MRKLYSTLTLAVLFFYTSNATTRYITQSGAGLKDGSSWANAGDSSMVQSLISASVSGDSIWIAEGTYYPTAYPANCTGCATYRDYSFTVQTKLFVYGGFVGTETSVSQRDLTNHVTKLSGDIPQTLNNDSDNCNHVMLYLNATVAGKLDGITVTNGYAKGPIITAGNTPVSIDNTLGGGVFAYNAKVTTENCNFSSNRAERRGGGVYLGAACVGSFSKSKFSSNRQMLNIPSYAGGGALCIDSTASATCTQTIFSGNHGEVLGGAVCCYRGTGTFTSCIFSGNYCNGVGGAAYGGTAATITFANTVFNSNYAYSHGGAIRCGGCTGNLGSCSFLDNTLDGSVPNLIDVSHSGVVTVGNSILWSGWYTIPSGGLNTTNSYPGYGGTLNTTSCNIIQANSGATSPYTNLSSPMGADNTWMTSDDGLQITCSSAAYNTGTCGSPGTDILGTSRPQNGTSDRGAYELIYSGTPPVFDSLSSSSDTVCSNASWHVNAHYHNTANATVTWAKNGGAWQQNFGTFLGSSLNTGDSVQCKIVSTDPCHPGTVYSSWRKVVVLKDTTRVTISYPIPICSGHPVTLTAVPEDAINPTYVWIWYAHGQVGTGPTLTINNPIAGEEYSVEMTATGACTVQTYFSYTITSLPVSNSQPSPTLSFDGTSLISSMMGSNSWFLNGNFLATTYSAYRTPTQSGCYYVINQLSANCPSPPSNTICVNLCSATAAFSSGGNTVCQYNSLQFTNTSTGGSSYTWLYDNSPVSTSQNLNYTFNSSGQHTIRLVASTGSCSDTTQETSITVNSTPNAATITLNGNVLSSSASSGNQWYLNGNFIPASNGQTYTPTQTGNYTVIVTSGSCPSQQSNSIYVNVTGIENLLEETITVSPNPATTQLNITIDETLTGAQLNIYNITGALVQSERLLTVNTQMSTVNLPSGIYIAEVNFACRSCAQAGTKEVSIKRRWVKM